jgi:hypothetical protein
MKSKTALTPQEMQLRSARARWSKFTKKERSEAMKRLRQNALNKAKKTHEQDQLRENRRGSDRTHARR